MSAAHLSPPRCRLKTMPTGPCGPISVIVGTFGGVFATSTLGLAAPDHAREQGAFRKILNLG
jgi:hypothetical protein